MNKKDLVSVIVPVYNVERYLQRCIDSILSQTYENIELILIDDGSTDRSGEICDTYKDDSRISVFHKENGGQASARNLGLDVAKGKWITFVDSDDFIAPDYVEYLLMLCLKYSVSISQCGFVRGTDAVFPIDRIQIREVKWNIHDLYSSSTRDFRGIVWSKMYSRGIIGDLRFPEGYIYEDEDFAFKSTYLAGETVISNRHLYYYYMTENSTMRGIKEHMNYDFIHIFDERIRFLKEYGEDELIDITNKELCIRLMLRYCRAKKTKMDKADCKKLKQEFRSRYHVIHNKKQICLKEKLAIGIFNLVPDLFAFIENHFSVIYKRKIKREKK